MDEEIQQGAYQDAGAKALALVTELFHQRGAPSSRFNDLIQQDGDPLAVTAAVVGLAVGLLMLLDERQPGSAQSFLEASGLTIENLEVPPGHAPPPQPE